MPLFFTKLPINALALRAVISTKPPSAINMCLLSTNALMMPWSTSTVVRLLPLNTSVALLPAANVTLPWCATMTPSLRTSGASRATKPASAACNVPWLTTLAFVPLPLKLLLPVMKSSLLMPMVVTSKPPTSTCDVAPKITPLALLMNTCPGALMRPMIWLGSPPTTRLSVTDDAEGWLKLTRASLPTLKLFQSIAARLLLWLMLSVLPVALMLALPPTTLPPLGNWLGAGAVCARARPTHKHAAARATRCGVKWAVCLRMV